MTDSHEHTDALHSAAARVLALHTENKGSTASEGGECAYDFEPWPCAAVEILGAAL